MIDIKINNRRYKLPALQSDLSSEKQIDFLNRNAERIITGAMDGSGSGPDAETGIRTGTGIKNGAGEVIARGAGAERAEEEIGAGTNGEGMKREKIREAEEKGDGGGGGDTGGGTGRYAGEYMEENIRRIELCRQALEILASVPRKEVSKIDSRSLGIFMEDYLIPLAMQVCGIYEKEKQFIHNGETFRFPQWKVDIDGNRLPLYNVSAERFCKASDMFDTDPELYSGHIISILCSRLYSWLGEIRNENVSSKDEKALYEDGKTSGRARSFSGHVKTRVIGELKLAHRYMRQEFPYCYMQKTTWADLLYGTASYIPSETDILKTKSCYEFMEFANSRLKSKQ